MIALIHRVKTASVSVNNKLVSSINSGIYILLGISKDDVTVDIDKIATKLDKIKIFNASDDKFSLKLKDVGSEILVVPQFTLLGEYRKGTKPEFVKAMQPQKALTLFKEFCQKLRDLGYIVKEGSFGQYMQVSSQNDGPVTFIFDSKQIK